MNGCSIETNATTSACPCYSDMAQYGSDGRVCGIQAPTPITAIPSIFLGGFKPHAMPTPHLTSANIAPSAVQAPASCAPYKRLGDM